jgi:myo-inositol 2-dehydrogenase / D-chiro-inositol 1-dehydrogenase
MGKRSSAVSRRGFLASSAAAVATSAIVAPSVHAAGNDVLKVALIGAGGRGTGACINALNADKNVKLVAVADIFDDRAKAGLEVVRASFKEEPQKIGVTPEAIFSGFDGYKAAIDMADVVVLATSPGFRPLHFAYAVEKGKHVFMEKPHAVDAVGARKVIEAAKLAEEKKLAVCAGFTYRYDNHKRDTVKRIHDKMIGDIAAIHTTFLTGELWTRATKTNDPKQMEYQMRMWYYFTWLSGDFIVEQAIHNVDKVCWLMNGEMPVSATGTGGRQARTDPKFGNIWDNFSITYEYASGTKVFLQCRQMQGCDGSNFDHVMGTKGSAMMQIDRHSIKTAGGLWKPEGEHDFGFAYQQEHNELFASIRAGKPMNDAVSSAYSTLMGIMGREAAYTGKKVSWAEMLKSKLDLSPKAYEWVENQVPTVAIPGKTKFV